MIVHNQNDINRKVREVLRIIGSSDGVRSVRLLGAQKELYNLVEDDGTEEKERKPIRRYEKA